MHKCTCTVQAHIVQESTVHLYVSYLNIALEKIPSSWTHLSFMVNTVSRCLLAHPSVNNKLGQQPATFSSWSFNIYIDSLLRISNISRIVLISKVTHQMSSTFLVFRVWSSKFLIFKQMIQGHSEEWGQKNAKKVFNKRNNTSHCF